MSALVSATTRQRDRALEVLLSQDLEPIVDMVSWSRADGAYEVASADGSVRFRRDAGADARDAEVQAAYGPPLVVEAVLGLVVLVVP
jgi:hypothetical protein